MVKSYLLVHNTANIFKGLSQWLIGLMQLCLVLR